MTRLGTLEIKTRRKPLSHIIDSPERVPFLCERAGAGDLENRAHRENSPPHFLITLFEPEERVVVSIL